ncbi:hypothetical protein RRV45_15065 [Bacillus sp. DTU_2020_1000418_1_SI_GHA_SEK_038]|uniref:hypothetical protein n=1 Tax=Bacillus sp. DTU_2020_1000418_1_SI_GHA_SEK_038 TaxID=3077585 RepID=UPI0028ED94D7|nr:hypothetical protein [Bacillus sp. DTU_2020_1000418_1_SI_GHA_SEK_038]WNS74229.1 hypothetical protein RRV45_15065 [Bacillus sp. DTU_2020_1000418_1_SI_GHA_SEK_038]
MKKLFEYLSPLFWIPLGIVIYLAYIHTISFLDPLLSIVFGGIFFLVVIVGVVKLLIVIKDIVVSIFKDDKTRDEKGFKKHF